MPRPSVSIHAVPVAGVAVSFYEPPSGKLELPWHSFEDLCAAARLDRGARDALLRRMRASPLAEITTTSDGTVVMSHDMAAGLIGAIIELGTVEPSFADAYERAGAAALEVLCADLTPSERFERFKALARDRHGVELVLPQ